MTRDDVLDVVKENFLEIVEDIDADTLDPSRSMKDYGATSLDMVEVVSASMRALRIKIPRSELNQIANIDQLVDALYAAVEAKSAA